MSQLGRFLAPCQDTSGNASVGCSVYLYREGASVNGAASGASPLTVNVRHRGKIATGDSVFVNSASGTTYTATVVSATQLQLSGFIGTLSLSGGDRLVPSNNQPTLYSDDQGGSSTSNPLTSDSTGIAGCWMKPKNYEVLVTGGTPNLNARLYQGTVVSVVYDGQLGTLFLRDATEDGDGILDQTLYSEVTRNLSIATSGQSFLSADIKTLFSNTTAFTNLSLNGLFSKNQYGLSGSGGGDVSTGIAIGAYSEHRGNYAITGAIYGAENAATMYNTGSVVSAFGSLNSAQITTGANAAIATAEGVAGYARALGNSAGSITTAIGVNGLAGLQDTSSANITDAIGGRLGTIKDGGVSGVITNAYGINILNITQGGTNNFGLRIAGASGGANINQSLRVDSGESQFIGPVTSPPVTFTDLATTPSVSGSNVFVASNSGATTITDFINDKDGQRITIVFTNANTTIQNNAGLINRTGANITPGANTTRSYLSRNGVWYETS